MAQILFALLIFLEFSCSGRAFNCLPLTPTNISCANYKHSANPLRAYCEGTRGGHVFWASSEQPLANALPSEYKGEVKFFQTIYAHVSDLVVKKRRDRHLREKCSSAYGRIGDRSLNQNWNKVQRIWRYAVMIHEMRLGLREPKSQCFTQVDFNTTKSRSIMQRMRKLNEVSRLVGERVAESARKKGNLASFFERQIGCWKSVVAPISTNSTTNALQCSVMRTAGFRRAGSRKFYLGISVTNAPIGEPRREKQRHHLAEIWTYDEKSDIIRAIPIPSFIRGDVNGLRNDTTTALYTWGGAAKMSYFMNIPAQHDPAMRRINEATSHLQDSIHDGITASNIAILTFPALLALIPISSFEFPALEDKLNRVLLYSAATDLVATLPLFIKGVELLVLATRRHTRCKAWTMGVEGDGVAVIEMWCADCVHHLFFQKCGTVFIVIALVFMVLGIVLETLTFLWVRRKRWHKKRVASKWWERAGISGDLCTEYECCCFQYAGTTPLCSITVNSRNAYFSHRRNLSKYC